MPRPCGSEDRGIIEEIQEVSWAIPQKRRKDWTRMGGGSRRLIRGSVGPVAPTEETNLGESRERWGWGSMLWPEYGESGTLI